MTDPAKATEAREGGFLAPPQDSVPVDHCFRCGVETPAGEGLCDEHNPNHLSGPSSTQMHATIFGGIVLGVIGFFIIATLAVGTSGPFDAAVTELDLTAEGGLAFSVAVTNAGETEGVADCRVTRDGIPRPDDAAFRSEALAAGETAVITRDVPPPPEDSAPYDTGTATVVCS